MKLRITSDELRLRLSAADLERLRQGHGLAETLALPDQQFRFELVCDGVDIGAVFSAGSLRVNVPKSEAVRWSVSDEETLDAVIGDGCRVSIEKDRRPD